MKLKIRLAGPEDMLLIYEWANDPVTRRMSFNQELIPLETHKKWFANILNQKVFYIVEVDGVPAAQFRIDEDGDLSYAIAPIFRGQRLATPILQLATRQARRRGLIKIGGLIKNTNLPALKAVLRAGWKIVDYKKIKGSLCYQVEYQIKKG